MFQDHGNPRRFFFRSLALSGLAFSGVAGLSYARRTGADQKKKLKHWDVIVAGGGPGGVPAAVAAARNGARVLLVERYGFLGGMATSALVLPYMKYFAGDRFIVRGLFEEFLDRMEAEGAVKSTFSIGGHPTRTCYDDEAMKRLLDRFVLDSGAELLLHTQAIGVLKAGKEIRAVRVFHKGGVEDLSADVFIDSTGDGDLAAWAGARVEVGRNAPDHACQPMTACFRMAGVDVARMPDAKEINRRYDEARARGEVKNPRENVLKFSTVQEDVIHFNTTRVVGESALDGWSMTRAEIEGRRQIADMVRFLRNRVVGFEKAYLQKTPAQIGVRESRRVIGRYVLTEEDVIGGRKFEDGVAACSYEIDIHNPTGTGTRLVYLADGVYYQIPYRSLLPLGVDNLVVAGRCVSSTHEAHSSLRIMPTVWAIGQAGGTAAALAVRGKVNPPALDVAELKKALTDQKAFI
jgi:hypothetical protein